MRRFVYFLLCSVMMIAAANGQEKRQPTKSDVPLRNWAVSFAPATVESNGKFVAATDAIPSGPMTFIAVPPCRIVDTRNAAGPFGGPAYTGAAVRSYVVPTAFNTAGCGTLPVATTYSLQFTVANYVGRGAVRTRQTGGVFTTAVLNLGASGGNPIGNSALAQANGAGSIDVTVTSPDAGNPSTSDLIIDLNGYFIENAVSTPTANTLVLRDANGDFSAHNITANSVSATTVLGAVYQDLAEWVPSASEARPGMVVTLDPADGKRVIPSTHAYDTAVAGVVSERPGIVLGKSGADKTQIATVGRVKVIVDADAAPIRVGDLLVTSDIAGVAMRSMPMTVNGQTMHRPGTIIGKAMEPLASGKGEIMVLLSLQ